MGVIENIESIIKRKKNLESLLSTLRDSLNLRDDSAGLFYVVPKGFSSGYSFHLKWDDILPLAEKQMTEVQSELDGVNKKLEAIGALMGAE